MVRRMKRLIAMILFLMLMAGNLTVYGELFCAEKFANSKGYTYIVIYK